jgi:tRNA (guanosine-2'-O-)-methyltransferase
VNVSLAGAVILFEAQRQRLAAGLYAESRLTPAEFDAALFEWSYPDIARRCRELKRRYPHLTVDGELTENPFAAALIE